jgi:hypothetical protein
MKTLGSVVLTLLMLAAETVAMAVVVLVPWRFVRARLQSRR